MRSLRRFFARLASFAGGTGFAKDHLLMTTFDPRMVQWPTASTAEPVRLVSAWRLARSVPTCCAW